MMRCACHVVRPPQTGVPVPGAIGGIEAIDVERQVGLALADDLLDAVDHRLRALLLHPVAVEDVEAVGLVIVGAQADLHRMLGIDQLLLRGMEEHGAVVEALLVLAPGVGMGVEMDQR